MDYLDRINKVNYFADLDWSTVKTPRYWFKNEPVITHIFNVFSLLIPETERFIVKALKPYEDLILDPQLSGRLHHFYREELSHSLQHTRFNEDLRRHNYPIDFILKILRISYRGLNFFFSPKTKVAFSVCFEHLTVMVAKIGVDTEVFEPGSSAAVDLFLWHAHEELNHRTFLMDVYLAIGGGYFRRIWAMMLSSLLIFVFLGPAILSLLLFLDLCKGRGVRPKHFRGFMKFMWQIKGIFKYYFSYYKVQVTI